MLNVYFDQVDDLSMGENSVRENPRDGSIGYVLDKQVLHRVLLLAAALCRPLHPCGKN